MDTSVFPTVALSSAGGDPAPTLSATTGGFVDGQKFVQNYSVTDADQKLGAVDVAITGGRDLTGNTATNRYINRDSLQPNRQKSRAGLFLHSRPKLRSCLECLECRNKKRKIHETDTVIRGMKIDTDKTMTFHYSIGRRIFLLIVYFLAFLLSIFLFTKGLEGDFKGKSPIFISAITAPFTLIQFMVSCFLVSKEDSFKFEVSPQGIYDDYISEKVIPWSNIQYFDTFGRHFNKMLRMKIDSQAMIEAHKAPLYIRANLESRFFQSDLRYLNHKGLGISFDYLTWVLGEYAKAHSCPAAADLEKPRPSPSRPKTLYGSRRDLY